MTTPNEISIPSDRAIPATMQAIARSEYGGPDVLSIEATPMPEPGEGQALVRVHATSVNPAEWHMMTGTPSLVRVMGSGFRRPKQAGLGADIAGVVVAVGEGVEDLSPGDEVFGQGSGAFAEYAIAPAKSLVAKPDAVTFEEAATTGIAAITAIQGLRNAGRLEAGHKVLVNGASGGVGTFAVQIAKALGAEVTAVSSGRNVEMVQSLGADRVVDYTTTDVAGLDERFDVILDNVGLPLGAARRMLNDGGRYVAVSGPKKTLPMLGRMLWMVVRSLFGAKKMKPFLAVTKRSDLEDLAGMLESGSVKPVIDRRYPFAATADAMAYQGEGHSRGKTVVTVIPEGV